MAAVNYPDDALPLPVNVGLVTSEVVPTRQVNTSEGPPSVFKQTDNQVNLYSVTWSLTELELRGFRGFYYNNLSNGSLWFNIQLPGFTDNAGELRLQEANFSGAEFSIETTGKRRLVTTILTIRSPYRDTQDITDGVLALLETGDDPVEFLNRLEIFANDDLGILP